MARIAFITSPFLGHILPTLPVGKELITLGHEVYWIGVIDAIIERLPRGGKYLLAQVDTIEYNESESHYGMESLRMLYENVLIPLNKAMYKGIKSCLQSNSFDFVVIDQQAFVGAIVAHELNIPYATSVTAPAAIDQSLHFPEVINFEKSQIIELQKRYGIDLEWPLVCTSPLTLVYSTMEFIQKSTFPSGYKFVGPIVSHRVESDFLVSEIDMINKTKPIVFISLGSILKPDIDFINKVIDAFMNEPITVILVADPKMKSEWPLNFHVFPFVPQLKVLANVDAVICHAGYNTVCEALSFGLPLITLPIVNDQSYVATKVSECGAGIRLKYRRLTSTHLRDGLCKILNEKSYRVAAEKVRDSFGEAGQEKRAAELIDAYIQSNINVDQFILENKN